jgi:hypothetical protein
MSPLPPMVLSAADIEYLIDECSHLDRGVIAGGMTAHRWLTERHEQENRARVLAKLPRIDFPAFLHLFVNELVQASRSHVNDRGWEDPWHLPEGVTFSVTDKQALRDVLTLSVIEDALWRRSEAAAAQTADTMSRAQTLVARHKQQFPDGEFFTGGAISLPPPVRIVEQARVRTEQPVSEMVSNQTGAPGRPTSMHLIESELRRRAESDDPEDALGSSIAVDADDLVTWFAKKYPKMARPAASTIIKRHRKLHRELREGQRTK